MICQVCGRIYLDGSAWVCSRCRRQMAESELRLVKKYARTEPTRPARPTSRRIRELARV